MPSFPQVGETFGGFQILDVLGHGGMGVVFRAKSPTLERHVALKVLAPQHAAVDLFRARFRREASILAAMNSPHIVAIHTYGEHDGCLYIESQLVPGGDLARHLARVGPFPIPQAFRLVAQVASALSAAHQAGVIHRDIKPGNVLLDEHDNALHAYLSDFGIAREPDQNLTQTGTLVGSIEYLAPERLDGIPATVSSDVYALGCLLHTIITGSAPYRGSFEDIMLQHRNAPVPQLPGSTPDIRHFNVVLQRSMAKSPDGRYPSASEMRRDLLTLPTAVDAGSAATVVSTIAHPEQDTFVATEITPQAAPAPAPLRRERGWKVPATIAALLLAVGAAVAAIVFAPSGDKSGVASAGSTNTQTSPRTSGPGKSEESRTISSSDGYTPSGGADANGSGNQAGAATRSCVDGREVALSDSCGEPRGEAGLRFVFPDMPRSGCRSSLTSLGPSQRKAFEAFMQCDQYLLAGDPVRVTYTSFTDYDAARSYLDALFDETPASIGGDLVQYPAREVAAGYEVARVYGSGSRHPFSASVACGRESKCLDAINEVVFTDVSRFDN